MNGLSWFRDPILILKHFVRYVFEESRRLLLRYKNWFILLVFVLLPYPFAKLIEGAHLKVIELFILQTLEAFETVFFWYWKWIILGILSSVGLGTGAHTFVLFLGPMIAECTTAAYTCQSLNFALFGPQKFICKGATESVTFLGIYMKVALEALAWGAGTAIGELPPYFVARACNWDVI